MDGLTSCDGAQHNDSLQISEDLSKQTKEGDIVKSHFYFKSACKITNVHGVLWHSDTIKPIAVVTIIHGMMEHIDRYDKLAKYLVDAGFAVCGIDLVGHGHSVSDQLKRSNLPAANGRDILLTDVHSFANYIHSRFDDGAAQFIIGHSMGSFIARLYCAAYSKELKGAIFSGTGQQPKIVSKAGNFLAHCIGKVKGYDYISTFVDNLGVGQYSKEDNRKCDGFAWLSTNNEHIAAYKNDDLCGTTFSVGGYAVLTDLTWAIADNNTMQEVEPALPMLFISGSEDLVGAKGVGVKKAANQLKDLGAQNVTVRLFDGLRHEILNDEEQSIVREYVLNWLQNRMKETHE